MRFSIAKLVLKAFFRFEQIHDWIISVFQITILFILLLFILNLQGLAQSTSSPLAKSPSESSSQAQQVKTGIYAINIYDLDIANHTYYIDFYLWLQWRGDLDPIAQLEFANGVEDWGVTLVPEYDVPQQLADDSLYQILRIEGRFTESFQLDRYPLDEQSLKISIENSAYTIDQLVYVADEENSGFAETLSISGWQIKHYQMQSAVHHHNFRLSELKDAAKPPTYSMLTYRLVITRPLNFIFWKLFLPLMLVMLSAWGALLLHPIFVELRSLIPVAALITSAILQHTYSVTLPELNYLVLLDKIYALMYALILAILLASIMTTDWARRGKPEDFERVSRFDRSLLMAQILVWIVGVSLMLLL
jgi:hypothetical protein